MLMLTNSPIWLLTGSVTLVLQNKFHHKMSNNLIFYPNICFSSTKRNSYCQKILINLYNHNHNLINLIHLYDPNYVFCFEIIVV